MADIKYLAGLDIDGNITLNGNQLVSAAINSGSSDPTGLTAGQLFFRSDTDRLRVYDGSAWKNVGIDNTNNFVDGGSFSGGTLTLSRSGLSDITITGFLQLGTTSTTALAGDTTTISSSQASAITANTAKVTFPGFGTTSSTAMRGNTTTISSSQASAITANTAKVTFPGFGTTSTTALRGDTFIPGAANNGILTIATSGIASGGGTFSANQSSNNTITITATEADTLSTVTARGATTGDDVTFEGDVFMEGTLDMNSGIIENLADPSSAQEAATKNYVDSSITGQLIYQGGYDASSAPPTGSSVLKGFTYTVTTAGDGNGFFTTELEIGDLIIAEQNNPTTEAHWTEVNKNVDLATTSTVGVASFSSSNFAVSAAGEVTVKNDGIILGTETTGNYVASLTASTNVSISGGSGEGSTPSISVPHANIDDRITKRQYAGLIGGSTSVTVASSTHGLGSDSSQFMVQLVEVSSGETVHAEVTRGSSGAVTIGFTSNPGTNAIRILINKIG